ncbi:hypothetical protein NPX13_g9760 [Xylaria arbuscula]|uniref:Heterokaryon incompatibility domain-containing protein n=1 Tax=Xylaria arbuscula TaxID=114810 RepID=A0A9W8N634_9PEZI|nr:hypothetical protein NPX13_g9760 [Xylaria arbuscula]
MGNNREASNTYLSPYNIRLLHINVNVSDPDAGELMVVHLNESPPYYALSHCWGQQVQNTDIVIGGTSIPILTELYVAIQRLRALAATPIDHPPLDPPLEYVWIDSICINQHDAQERSTQVQLMGAIYSRAIRTLIWLGPEFDSSFAAWKLIDDIYDIFHVETPTAQTLEDIPQCMYSDAIHAMFELPPWDSPVWSYLKQLLDLRWFSRIWVIQEVLASPGLGRRLVASKGLHAASAGIANDSERGHAVHPPTVPRCLAARRAAVGHTSQVPCHRPAGQSLEFAGASSRVLFGSRKGDEDALLTRTRGPMGSLSRTRRTTELPDLPSWVPDYSDFVGYNRHIRTSFSWVHYAPDEQQQPATLGYPKNYAAAAQTSLKIYDEEEACSAGDSVSESQNGSTLRVGGIVITHIERVVSPNTSPTCCSVPPVS